MNKIKSSEINSHLWSLIFNRGAKAIQWERTVFLTTGAGTTG